MEVFMRNLPPDLSQTSLRSQLKPHMDKLRITHYGCQKRPRQKIGKVVFVTEKEAKAFLQSHGEVPLPNARRTGRYPPTQSRLFIMNHQVYCKRSDPQPQDIRLRVKNILHEAEEEERIAKAAQFDADHHPRAKHTPSTLETGALDCGYWSYVNNQLTFVNEWSSFKRQNLVKFTKKDLIITFSEPDNSSDIDQVRISYRSIYELVWSDDGHVAVTLKFAPTFLSSPFKTDRPGPPTRMRLKACDHNHALVSNFCLVYHFNVDPRHLVLKQTPHRGTDFRIAMNGLTHQEFFYVSNYAFAVVEASTQDRFPAAIDKLRADLVMYEGQRALPQTLLFSLQALVHESYLHPTTVSKLAAQLVALFETARRSGSREHPISPDAFKELFTWIQYPSPHHEDFSQFEVEGIIEHLKETEEHMREGYTLRMNNDVPSHLTKIFRAVVTPARITFHGPELEAKNRILRKFPDNQDHFLRVQFSEEDGQDLFFNSRVSMEGIYERFKDVLTKGITVGGRVYRFLGFSHSSLRAHTVWLSSPFLHNYELMLPERIISDLGDFCAIRSPARRAARIGQAFSETPYPVSLDDHGITVRKKCDVERNRRIFSDGVGTISQGALEAIHCEIPWTKGRPTCFQVRWGGAKGMLALDARLAGRQFTIRRSMEKFQSSDTIYLEICDMASKPIPMVLNRQLIKILEDMGAPESWFMKLQEKQLASLRRITDDAYNVSAFLKFQSIGDSIHLDQLLKDAHKMKVDYRKDPFLRGIVEAAVLRELRLVKHKSKIPVPKGVTLFGIMDETGLLNEHEVYVTYTHDPEDKRFTAPPANSRVVVTRSPALHPGDIQIARNIIPPPEHPLAALRNCIVFSQHGERDLPSQLSGGDLDGDMFNVIWDERIIPKLQTFGAADYPRVEPVTFDREIQSSDMADFFVDFMKTDHLGVIAVRHMIFADLQPDGTRAPECLRLAELHSNAVDFSKSGRPVNITHLPRAPSYRPDFLSSGPIFELTDKSTVELEREYLREDDDDDDDDDRPRHGFYKSDKVLGKLYRAVDESQIWTTDIKKQFPLGGPSFWDELKVALVQRIRSIGRLDWKKRLDDAYRICEAYDEGIKGAMVNFADSSAQPLKELEVVMGFILNSRGIQTKRQRDKSTKLSDEFSRISRWVTNEMRASAIPVDNSPNLSILELCFACFEVACAQKDRGRAHRRRGPRADLESFRIVAASALIREIKEQEKLIRLRNVSNAVVNVRGESRMAGRGGRGGHRQPFHAEVIRVDVENATCTKAQRSTSLGFESPGSTSSPATPSSGQGYMPSTGPSMEAAMYNSPSAHHPGYQPELVRTRAAAGTAGASEEQGLTASPASMPVRLTAEDLMAHLAAQYAQMQIHQRK